MRRYIVAAGITRSIAVRMCHAGLVAIACCFLTAHAQTSSDGPALVVQPVEEATALETAEELVPDSRAAAMLYVARGDVFFQRGEYRQAEAQYSTAIRLLHALSGHGSLRLADVKRRLGVIYALRGDLEVAEELIRTALKAYPEKSTPEAPRASALAALGLVNMLRGDVNKAESHFQRSLAIRERNNDWPGYHRTLFNLSDVAYERGDFNTSESLLNRALEYFREYAPESSDVAYAMTGLGGAQIEMGKYDVAAENLAGAVSIYEELAPDSLRHSIATLGQGEIALASGDLDDAFRQVRRAVDIRERRVPHSMHLAEAYRILAQVYEAADDLSRAREYLSKALAIQSDVQPGSSAQARTLYLLARLSERTGDKEAADSYYERSIAALESQTNRLGGAERSRAQFTAGHSAYFKGFIEFLLSRGDSARAFRVLERYRARGFLALRTDSALGAGSIAPADLTEDARARQESLKRAQKAFVSLINEGADPDSLAAARDRLTEAQVKWDGVLPMIWDSNLEQDRAHPAPLDLIAAQSSLPRGTLALSYSVGTDRTYAFAVTRDSLRTYSIEINELRLRERIKQFVYLLDGGRHASELSVPLRTAAEELYDLLLSKVDEVADADRLLLVPDGPLHLLPFIALVYRESDDDVQTAPRFLIERLPVHRALSLTLYSERLAVPKSGLPTAVAAFADPNGTGERQDTDGSVRTRSNVTTHSPLPFSRDEVESLSRVFGGRVTSYVGELATETQFREAAPAADVLHIAAHAIVDETSPVDSAIVFHEPAADGAEDDGLLQAWEVFEGLRVPQSLVVLSACSSALGRDASGEGLLGLKRAFQFAGARAVIASLWKVSDRSTSRLMVEFYRARADGAALDRALRDAQLELLNGGAWGRDDQGVLGVVRGWFDSAPDHSHPYYWAAFHLTGDHR